MDDDLKLFWTERFTCESCGRTIILPFPIKPPNWEEEARQRLEREKAIHHKECTGPPHVGGHG